MRAIQFDSPGEPDVMYIGKQPTPAPLANEVLVRVFATALNRADTLQRRGKYPPPSGASPILGLEMAGEIVKVGEGVSGWNEGQRVMALLSGGGYAEYVTVHEDMLMEIPENLDYISAAAIPEVFLTAFQAVDWLADLQYGESILIHAGASGVGTAAIQLATAKNATVYITASQAKHQICLDLGVEKAIDYQVENFQQQIETITQGKGVNVIIDFIAGPYFQQNLNALGLDGRLVILALLGGGKIAQANILNILRKRLQITGSTLRSRSASYKQALTKAFWDFSAEKFRDGTFSPIIDSVYPWEKAPDAHRRMEHNENAGKIVLEIAL